MQGFRSWCNLIVPNVRGNRPDESSTSERPCSSASACRNGVRPDLDVDLSVESIDRPDRFPLVGKVERHPLLMALAAPSGAEGPDA